MRKYCKLVVISAVLFTACSNQDSNQVAGCEDSIALCTFEEIIPGILHGQPSTPLEVDPFTIDLIKQRYGVEEIDCSHPLLSDNSEFVRIAELSPPPGAKIWYSREELEKYETETAWECNNGESFVEYAKGYLTPTSEFFVVDQAPEYGILKGTVKDPEVLKQLEILWEKCKVGTEPPGFTGIFTNDIGFLPPEDQRFCVTLDILPGAKQCFAKIAPPESVEYSIHGGETSINQTVSEADYCRVKGNTGGPVGRVKIF